MLPDIPQLRHSLAALSVIEARQESPSQNSLLVCESRGRLSPDGVMFRDESSIFLIQEEGAPLSLTALVERVATDLHKNGHAHVAPKSRLRSSLSLKILSIACMHSSKSNDTFAILNILLKEISKTRVTQWAVLPSFSTGSDQYQFGDFSYGEIDLSILRYRCERAGSDFFDIYEKRLRGRRSICRDGIDIVCISIHAIKTGVEKYAPFGSAPYRVCGDYYGELSDAEQRRIMVDLDEQQAVFGAAGLGTISSKTVSDLSGMTYWIIVFTRQQKNQGWVIPNQSFFQITTVEPKALAQLCSTIRQALRLEDWGKRPIDGLIQTYSDYMVTSKNYEQDGRIEEALLHLIFGLDLLLGGDSGDPLTAVLAERVAVLSHVTLNRSVNEMSKFIKECYDMRSGYAHRGKRGKLDVQDVQLGLGDRLDLLTKAARVVLGAACFARLQPWCQIEEGRKVEEGRKAWLARIDLLKAKLNANLILDPSDLSGLGLDRVPLFPPDPTA